MLSLKNSTNYTYEYNSMLDILHIKIAESERSYGHEDDYGIILNYDFSTKELVSIDIWNFKLRVRQNEEIPLPINIDLKKIYNSI